MWRWGFRRSTSTIRWFGKHSSEPNSRLSFKSRGTGSIPLLGENGVQLLVLDEATSALDAETERIIIETLDSLAGDVTLIVIAHRLATVRHCDQVTHLSGGRITGRGTFAQMRAQVPEFNRQAELVGL